VGESVRENGRGKAQPGSGRDLTREDGTHRHRRHHHEHQLREGKRATKAKETERQCECVFAKSDRAGVILVSLHSGERPHRVSFPSERFIS